MLFALLEWNDFAIIVCIVAVFSGGAAATVFLRPVDRNRLERVEQKLDLILKHLGLDYTAVLEVQWKALADDSTRKIAAIKVYRELHGVGLAEAKRAVEEYMRKG
jgi:hypothetical protein